LDFGKALTISNTGVWHLIPKIRDRTVQGPPESCDASMAVIRNIAESGADINLKA